MAHRRPRRAPLRFRRPLRLYLADRRGLCRQHRDDPRPRRSGTADGGRALVDSRPMEGRRRGVSVGQLGRRRAATIRCAWAIASMSATGTTASSFSIFPTCRRPKVVAHANTSPAFPHPTHTCLPIPQSLKGRRIMVVADEDVAKLRPSAPSFTWIYDITDRANAAADRDLPGARARQRRQPAAADERLPSAVGTVPRHRDSVRMVRAGPASRRHRGSLRAQAKSAIFCQIQPTARIAPLPTM